MRARSVAPLLVILLAALASGACERRQAPAAPDPLAGISLDACTLLTEAEAEQLLDLDLRPMSAALDRQEGIGSAKCSYGRASGGRPDVLSIELRRFRSPAEARIPDASLALLRTLTRGDMQEIPGLGQQAWWLGRELQQVQAVDRNRRLIVTVELGPKESHREVATRAARIVFDRLDAMTR